MELTTPLRVVDADNHGWWLTGDERYATSGNYTGITYAELAERGPLRPVEPMGAGDVRALHEIMMGAGRRTVTTLCAALDCVFHDLRESRGGLRAANESYDYAERTLIAGRPGSWESVLLIELVLFGNGLNLARGKNWTVERMRAEGPHKRVDRTARAEFVAILTRWVTDPNRFVEVAENLAYVVSSWADQTGGWASVADQWLQPNSLARQDFVSCYKLLYSLSADFRPEYL